jgi:pimeloyl-ACP methyl ester carboxylesterase
MLYRNALINSNSALSCQKQRRLKEMAEEDQTFSLPDGRQLGYLIIGKGKPIFYFHGTASSRLEVLLLKELTRKKRLRLIGVDRPGAGLSTFAPKKCLSGFNADISHLAGHLGLDSFAVLGWSGGGPYALTYLAFFPERVTRAVVIGSPALPFDVATAHNTSLARFAMKFPALGMLALKRLQAQVLSANKSVEAFLHSKNGKNMLKNCSKEDTKFFADKDWATLMFGSMAEAFRQGDDGVKAVFQEHQLFMKTWPKEVSRIPQGSVDVWQGTDDKTCRVDNAYRIGEVFPGAHLEIFQGKGHCVMFDNLEKLGETLLR